MKRAALVILLAGLLAGCGAGGGPEEAPAPAATPAEVTTITAPAVDLVAAPIATSSTTRPAVASKPKPATPATVAKPVAVPTTVTTVPPAAPATTTTTMAVVAPEPTTTTTTASPAACSLSFTRPVVDTARTEDQTVTIAGAPTGASISLRIDSYRFGGTPLRRTWALVADGSGTATYTWRPDSSPQAPAGVYAFSPGMTTCSGSYETGTHT